MSALQTSSLIFSSSSSSSSSSRRINAAIHVPKLSNARFPVPKKATVTKQLLIEGVSNLKDAFINVDYGTESTSQNDESYDTRQKLYAILEAVSDRVEMHDNIGHQRDNWNTLLLNSINMITLTASTLAGVASAAPSGTTLLALKLGSTLLFSAAAGMLLVTNKLQPSQLAEEQRNASRLFRQIKSQIETVMALGSATEYDVKDFMDKVLALDRAYPLPLLGAMLEKFPQKYEPATWWPSNRSKRDQNESTQVGKNDNNGWTHELEEEMREIINVVKNKDSEDYERLGNLFLKINKVLAISGPLLTGIAAVSAPFVGNGPWGGVLAVTAGALASVVNSFQHGLQVGMVFEMYRNNGGFFKLLEEEIEAAVEEKDLEKRENVELFQMKVALQLGRNLPQLKELATKSASFRTSGTAIDEFASKLF
ncbi:Petal formation-expressed [Trema orientale]|uniref:Petal formation-expressed n=1 Tax=Trema orientale TaxID=63057 RepID=A0A2P5F0C9_TREOI|nr:Petal formation-expressed [Trema orientale]